MKNNDIIWFIVIGVLVVGGLYSGMTGKDKSQPGASSTSTPTRSISSSNSVPNKTKPAPSESQQIRSIQTQIKQAQEDVKKVQEEVLYSEYYKKITVSSVKKTKTNEL